MGKRSNKRLRSENIKRWKTFSEKEILECYFVLDPSWAKKTMVYVKDLVKLSEEQIYKWGYERKRKLRKEKDAILEKEFAQRSYEIAKKSVSSIIDYNLMVNDIFSDKSEEPSFLTYEEKAKYDQVRDELIRKDAEFQQMPKFERILYERLRLSDIFPIAKDRIDSEWINFETPKNDQSLNTTPVLNHSKLTFDDSDIYETNNATKSKRESKSERKCNLEIPDFEYVESQSIDFESDIALPDIQKPEFNEYDFRFNDYENLKNTEIDWCFSYFDENRINLNDQ